MYTIAQIKEFIKNDRLDIFYNNGSWRRLSKAVIREQHSECQICRSKGIYSKATVVHHVKPIKMFPQYAYTRYVTDDSGNKQIQLLALCRNCHEEIEGRSPSQKSNRFYNIERW